MCFPRISFQSKHNPCHTRLLAESKFNVQRSTCSTPILGEAELVIGQREMNGKIGNDIGDG